MSTKSKKRRKFVGILLWISIMTVSTSVFSQKVTLNYKSVPLETVFKEIEKQIGYSIFYSEDVDHLKKVSIECRDKPVSAALDLIFKETGLAYSISGKYVNVQKKAETKQSVGKGIVGVVGTVFDENGERVPGATITVKGTTRGVITDLDGKFTIDVNPADVLEINVIGYQTYTVAVGEQRQFDIRLQLKTNELDEITVVAFGKQKKESVISSISTVNMKDLKIPSSNLTTALAGRISGLVSYQRSGEPGQDDASFFVRGVTSLTYASGPLILIDGVEMSSSDLARLQPDDIASFSIMKDATATALYGARGANGAILVTTKEGKEGNTTISARVESSLSSPTQKVKLADPITYMQMFNEAVLTRNKMGQVPYPQAKIDNTMNPNRNQYIYPANDWYNMLFKDETFNYRANFNVSGGGKVARYYIAATYNQDNGVLKVDKKNNFNNNIDLKRYLLRTNVNINLTKTTEAVVRLHGTFDDYQGPIDGGSTLYQKVMRSDPVRFPAYYAPDEANLYTHHILFGNDEATADFINPYADMLKGYKDYTKSLMMAQFEVKQKLDFFLNGLSMRGLYTTNRYSYFDVVRNYVPYYYNIAGYDKYTDIYQLFALNPEAGKEYLNYSEGKKDVTSTTYMEAAINYDQTFAKVHAVSGMLVYTRRNTLEANAGSLILSLPSRNQGVSGRATYAYDNKYFSEFNFGYNGSERFAKRYRYGFFPSMGLGWILSNENFWNDNLRKTVSKLKFKGTYGLVGNDAIGDKSDRFFYLSNVSMDESGRAFTFGTDFNYTRNGVAIMNYENDKITWEVSRKMNLGVEIGLFDKIEIIADYYTERRNGLLQSRSNAPASMGLVVTPQANLGKANGEGIDLSIDYQHSITKNFWVTGRANFTYAITKYTEYEEVDNTLTPWLSKIGQPVSQQWGYVAERLFVDDKEVANSPVQNIGTDAYGGGDIKYRDINGDDKINSLDMVPIGFPTEPQIIYGFGLSSGYKNFDLSFFFQGLAQESFWINTAISADNPSTVPFLDTDANNSIRSQNALLKAYADSHWDENNKDIYAMFPRFSDKMVSNNYSAKSTWFMHDGSFIRLKSAELGYTVPQHITQRVKMANLRFYASGTNLLTFSKFKLWDPEMAGNGLGYPVQRVLNLGLQLTF